MEHHVFELLPLDYIEHNEGVIEFQKAFLRDVGTGNCFKIVFERPVAAPTDALENPSDVTVTGKLHTVFQGSLLPPLHLSCF